MQPLKQYLDNGKTERGYDGQGCGREGGGGRSSFSVILIVSAMVKGGAAEIIMVVEVSRRADLERFTSFLLVKNLTRQDSS